MGSNASNIGQLLYTPSEEWQILSSIYHEFSCYQGACDLPKAAAMSWGLRLSLITVVAMYVVVASIVSHRHSLRGCRTSCLSEYENDTGPHTVVRNIRKGKRGLGPL